MCAVKEDEKHSEVTIRDLPIMAESPGYDSRLIVLEIENLRKQRTTLEQDKGTIKFTEEAPSGLFLNG